TLLLEGSNLKLRDANSSGKVDVHCFLFSDILLICKSVGKKSGDKVRVIRPPYLIDRTIVHELKDSSGFILVYLNEFNVATNVFTLYSPDSKTWIDYIRKAQKKYKESKQNAQLSIQSSHYTEEDEEYEFQSSVLLPAAQSSLRSSRSSLVQSHSGSVEMSDTSTYGSMIVAPMSTPQHYLSQIDINQQHNPSRAVSFELGELRNPSMTVDDLDSFGRSKSMETRTPVGVTVTSPRPERRAFLLRGAGGVVSGNTNSNTLSVNVPYLVSKQTQSSSEPPSIPVPILHSNTRPLQRSVQTLSKPPLVKMKNIATPSLTVQTAPPHSLEPSVVYSVESEPCCEHSQCEEQESLKSKLNQKRNNRCERRYHTADSIDNIKKDKDTSIHKRLSWNLGANQGNNSNNSANNRLLCNKHLIKCLSSDSVYTSSGFSSTESVTLSVGSSSGGGEQCCTGDTMLGHIQEIDHIPEDKERERESRVQKDQKEANIKIDVSEVKDGISSVQITVNGNCGAKPDLKKMKEIIFTSLEA
ncbi:pleckstriny domain-containing family G member 5-like protein, partial [Dinothrombium tinctorium]